MTLEDRFRANLLVSGCAEMTEFTWKTLHIGTVEFKVDPISIQLYNLSY